MDLFEEREKNTMPLAARMRPRTLSEFFGQQHIIAPGRLLYRAIQADQLSSLIFYGPPGVGKTTLARIIANTTSAHFLSLNAVLAGVKDLRAAVDSAKKRKQVYQQKTILFIDEVHRWNKAQQDALLPWVEDGIIILIGATTENPYFEVIKPLVSRSRIFQLKPLSEDDLQNIIKIALYDKKRGYGDLQIEMAQEAEEHLIHVANGDARCLLNALELAIETTPQKDGIIHIHREVAEESIQKRAVLYDKEGDVHYDTISAFIKSLRGSDPDAALYWMARMVYAGEDPRFIFRRMLIFAGEDVGMADPNAICITCACAQAFEYVGMPEGRFHLSQAAVYLATAPKSNTTLAFFDALSAVEKENESEVPNHLRDAGRDGEAFGHGKNYLYPHAYKDHWVAQQYLPESLQGRVFYTPSDQGYENKVRIKVEQKREAQLAAMLEGESVTLPEILTFTGKNLSSRKEQWLKRVISGAGDFLAQIRETIFDSCRVERHHLLLDINAGSGLLTWEAMRRAPEGRVYSLVSNPASVCALEQQVQNLSVLERPLFLTGNCLIIKKLLADAGQKILFDAIIGRNFLASKQARQKLPGILHELLAIRGKIAFAQVIPADSQRLSNLLNNRHLPQELIEKTAEAEEMMYKNPERPDLFWNAQHLSECFIQAGYQNVQIHPVDKITSMQITPSHIDRWFSANQKNSEYSRNLATFLAPEEIKSLHQYFSRYLCKNTVPWRFSVTFLTATK